jgi:hypothetical protein
MFVKRALVMALVSIFMTTAALSQSRSLQQETIACQDDALRLCGPYIPDHAKIHSCLLTYKAYISPACRAIVAPPHHQSALGPVDIYREFQRGGFDSRLRKWRQP